MNIKTYLHERHIKQKDFADKIGISRQLLNWHLKDPSRTWQKIHAENIIKEIYGEVIREKVVSLILGEGI